jgi:beta-glucosidase
LNKNGKLDPYEDARAPVEKRVQDLLSQMTLAEKVGLMFAPIVGLHPDGSVVEDESFYSQIATPEAITRRHINHLGSFMPTSPEVLARWCNAVQRLAENTRLGIPVTVYSDPRHGVDKAYTINNAFMPGLTHAPDPLGLAAMRDAALLEELASVMASEYRACGIHVALHPMADLATEPRWGRIAGTFGEDAKPMSGDSRVRSLDQPAWRAWSNIFREAAPRRRVGIATTRMARSRFIQGRGSTIT